MPRALQFEDSYVARELSDAEQRKDILALSGSTGEQSPAPSSRGPSESWAREKNGCQRVKGRKNPSEWKNHDLFY